MDLTRTIAAPRRTLFDFLIDFRNERFFGPTIRSCRLERSVPGPRGTVGEGSEFVFEYRILGFTLTSRFRVEDVVDGERLTIRSFSGPIPFVMAYAFEDAGSQCLLTVRTTLGEGGWLRWLRPIIAPAVRRDMTAYMNALERYWLSAGSGATEKAARPSAADPQPAGRAVPPRTS